MFKQRGITVLGFIGVIFLMAVAFYAGSFLQVDADIRGLDDLFDQTCDTESTRSGRFLSSSEKYYRCEFVRNMTPEEKAERAQRIDDAAGRKSKKTGEDPAGATTPQLAAELPDPEETREK